MSKAKVDGMAELVGRIAPPDQTEVCFIPQSDSVVRYRGSARDVDLGLYAVTRQITFRCGVCWQPVVESELAKHFSAHVSRRG